jgi:hypothetical protein
MGQAKRRGTYEQRKAAAEERSRKELMVKAQLLQRRPSPEHVALMGMIAALSRVPNAELSRVAAKEQNDD